MRTEIMKLAIIGIASAATLLSIGQVAAADGKAVYEKSCKGCHTGMLPKFGNKAEWAPLVKRGAKDMTASHFNGAAITILAFDTAKLQHLCDTRMVHARVSFLHWRVRAGMLHSRPQRSRFRSVVC